MSAIDQDNPDHWASLRSLIIATPAGTTVAVSVKNLRTGTTFSHLGDRRFPAASTIKLLILIAVARAVDAGTLDLSTTIVPDPHARVGGSGVLSWLSKDLAPTIADHAWLMIAVSDNTASNILIDAVGVPAIHDAGSRLGLRQTTLNRRFLGHWPGPDEPDNGASSDDLVSMLSAIADDTAASPESCAWMRRLLGDQQHVEQLGRKLPAGVTYAGKTGWITGICHDCGLLTGPGGTIAVAVLTSGFPDKYEAQAFVGEIGALLGGMIEAEAGSS